MKRNTLLAATAAAALAAFPAAAQDDPHAGHAGHTAPDPAPTPAPAETHQDHSQHGAEIPAPAPAPHQDHSQHGAMAMDPAAHHAMPQHSSIGWGSGTARVPAGEHGSSHGTPFAVGDWQLAAHASLWGVYTEQGGPRGDEMAFVESMAMLTAGRDLGDNTRLQLRTMLSLEPAMGAPGYPNLFATGETAGGEPLVDRQHPHDLFMELSARIDFETGDEESIFVYGGPVAEPALGPSAFMHRGSAASLPLAPITHHWFDSTHITYGVVTLGYATPRFQFEASAFRGLEPDEERWNIETPALDSWSLRASWAPSRNWVAQVSYGRLKQPEAAHPGQDEGRLTASVQYAQPNFDATLAFSSKNRLPGNTLTAWLAEANWQFAPRNMLFGRVENVANDELFPDHDDPLHDRKFRVTRFEAGYGHRIELDPVSLTLGGSLATYAKPDALDAAYGDNPFSWTLFAKLGFGAH